MKMELDYNQKQKQNNQRHSGGGGGGGATMSQTSSSSDLNNSSSSNSISLSHSNSNSQHNQQHHPRHHPNHQNQNQNQNQNQGRHDEEDPMQSWWESVSKARSRIHTLVSLLPSSGDGEDDDSLSSLADSDRPARSLLESQAAYTAVSSALTGSGDDPLCQWLYDTFQQSEEDESDLRLVVLSFVPLLAGLYLTRIHGLSTTTPSPGSASLAGFEAVLLALYSSQTKSRGGKPLLVSIPTPAFLATHPSLYHHPSLSPSPSPSKSPPPSPSSSGIGVAVLCPPLEPQVGIKSTKRASIIGVAFHFFYTFVSHMPSWSKIDLCRFAAQWAGDQCPCSLSLEFNQPHFDDSPLQLNGAQQPNGRAEIIVSQDTMVTMSNPNVSDNDNDNDNDSSSSVNQHQHQQHGDENVARIPLPWELLQPLLRIIGHCLLAPAPLVSEDIKDAASVAVSRLYARASHDLSPQAILATRALFQLHNRARAAAKAAAFANSSSNATTPTSLKKLPEMLLVSN